MDREIVLKCDVTCFFKHRDIEKFKYLCDNKDSYSRVTGIPFDHFILLYKKTFMTVTFEENNKLEKFLQILMNKEDYTALDLDILWLMYYASGDKVYSKKVESISETTKDPFVKSAALWSYSSHLQRGQI